MISASATITSTSTNPIASETPITLLLSRFLPTHWLIMIYYRVSFGESCCFRLAKNSFTDSTGDEIHVKEYDAINIYFDLCMSAGKDAS
jgi:hypothetical protein